MSNMMSAISSAPMTAPIDSDSLYEVVGGQVVETEPRGARQVRIATFIAHLIEAYARPPGLGCAVVEMLFVIDPSSGLRRRPDVAFVSFERWPRERPIPDDDAWDVIPDLAVEVVSRTNDFDEVLEKVSEYLAAGVELVWVVIPSRHQIYVYRSETDLRVLTRSEHLDGETVLPGFRCPVAEVFEA
jgi:Uma2 family endonuclease